MSSGTTVGSYERDQSLNQSITFDVAPLKRPKDTCFNCLFLDNNVFFLGVKLYHNEEDFNKVK